MRRMCFDLESNYFQTPYRDGGPSIRDPAEHRAVICKSAEDHSLVFQCGVVYDESENTYNRFWKEKIEDMVALLSRADGLISHSGRRHDIPILECLTGVINLRKIPHWDLLDCVGWTPLDDMVKDIPGKGKEFDADYVARLSEIDREFPGDRYVERNKAERLMAKAYHDVERTYAIWKFKMSSGKPPKPTQYDLG